MIKYSRRVLQWAWEHRPAKKWLIGAAVATPVAAVVQGVILLEDFRERHSDAPTPITPSRGVVVTVPKLQNNTSSNNNSNNNKNNVYTSAAKLGDLVVKSVATTATLLEQSSQEPPLRILIIGDSLAAGVGVSRTGTPVLPESIARTLSTGLGGRPVYWTCVGTPGASAARIVHDIDTYQESLLVRQPTIPPELLVTESWIQGVQRQWRTVQARRERIKHWWETLGNPDNVEGDADGTDKKKDNNIKQHQNEEALNNNEKNEQNKAAVAITQWWRRVKRDAQAFGQAWKGDEKDTKTASKEEQAKGKNTSGSTDDNKIVDPFQLWQRWRQRLQRRSSLRNPEIVGQFDVAIVLTGLNDLKEATLPFMFRGRNASINPRDDENKGVMAGLERVLEALQQKMSLALDRTGRKRTESQTNDDSSYALDNDDKNVEKELLQSIKENEKRLNIRSLNNRRRPLVVFPALPVSPLPIFHSAPLRWFALPLFRRVDNYKREVANRFPGEVLFVDTPTDDAYAEIEDGTGTLWDERRREQVLLRLTDIKQKARAKVEEVMKEHYQKWARTMGAKESHSYNHQTPEEATHSSQMEKYHRPGSSLISVDGVHPNDDGYEFWGRHIALAIVEEWKRQDRALQDEDKP